MKIAIVILNWNGMELLEKFLPSVVEHSKQASIYVADNASTDDSVETVKRNFSGVKIIQNRVNFGYATGYNEAIKLIDEDILCFLNNDVEVSPNWLDPIINLFKSENDTAIIQPKILDYNKKDYFEYAGAGGGYIDKFGYPYCRGRIFNTIEKDEGQYNDVQEIRWSSGACLFIRKAVFNELGGFDENYFAHMEEIDLCWRAKSKGYKIKFTGSSVVYHLGGATLKNSNPKKTYLNFRNSLFTLVKNAGGNLFSLIMLRLMLDGVAAIRFLFKLQLLHFAAIVKAHISFYKHLPNLKKQRKILSQNRNYYTEKSIVWSYFVLNKKYYNRL